MAHNSISTRCVTWICETRGMFSKMCNIDEYAVYGTFKRRYFCEWNFYYSSKGKLTLLVPVCKRYEEIIKMNKPKTDQKVRVYYYKHSKILYSWEEL